MGYSRLSTTTTDFTDVAPVTTTRRTREIVPPATATTIATATAIARGDVAVDVIGSLSASSTTGARVWLLANGPS